MKSNFKNFVLWFYPKFHVFTITCTIGFLFWQSFDSEPIQPTLARVVEVVAPNLLDFLSGGSALNPTDFVHQHKH